MPIEIGGAHVSQYDVQMLCLTSSSTPEPSIVYSGRLAQCVVAGLSAGLEYSFDVRASNSAGVSYLSL